MPDLRAQLEQLRNSPQGRGLLAMIRTGEGTARYMQAVMKTAPIEPVRRMRDTYA